MSKLIRHFLPGQSCFITSVTAGREPLLVRHTRFLAQAVRKAKGRYDFTIVAWVILPDHIHLILDAPDGDTPEIMRCLKLSFSGHYRFITGKTGPVWQRRYWDHIIRSQDDMNRHIDYIHYNPVSHGLVDSPRDYSLSSFRRFCRKGRYDWNWRAKEEGFDDHKYGE